MCDGDDELDDFDFPGSEIGGYNLLYLDPISQAEAMFSEESETVADTDPLPSSEPLPILPILLRILRFLFCFALSPIWLALWRRRSRCPR